MDEIGDMELATQTKVLRVLQEGEIQRVGGSETFKVNARLVAATNKDLEKMVEEKEFREDLYYRLNVARIRLPNLKERSADIPELIDFMLQRLAKQGKSRVNRISSDVRSLLEQYPWPGNVRELENVIDRASVLAQGDTILSKDLPSEIHDWAKESNFDLKQLSTRAEESSDTQNEVEGTAATATDSAPEVLNVEDSYELLYKKLREDANEDILTLIERAMIVRALEETGGNQVRTSAILGITRATLRKRIEQYKEEK